jgi:molybdenum ABC transporter molybdate-binding protein
LQDVFTRNSTQLLLDDVPGRVPADSTTSLRSAADLASLRRIALADPEAVPAGVYARTYLQSAGLWEKLKEKVLPTLNVRAALAAVESGNVEAGIVYRTDAAVSRRVRVAFEVGREGGQGSSMSSLRWRRPRRRPRGISSAICCPLKPAGSTKSMASL